MYHALKVEFLSTYYMFHVQELFFRFYFHQHDITCSTTNCSVLYLLVCRSNQPNLTHNIEYILTLN